jgi:DNA polymerase III epsilon subunit-like protein
MVLVVSDYFIFDTETDGHNPQGLIQLSVATNKGKVHFDKYIKPTKPMFPAAIAVHGIPDCDLEKEDNEEEVYNYIVKNLVKSKKIFVAQNGTFDVDVINTFLYRCKGESFHDGKDHNFCPRLVDTLAIARKFIDRKEIGNHKLDTLFIYLFPDRVKELFERRMTHDALEDCLITNEVLLELGERYLGTQDIEKMFKKMGDPLKPKIIETWPVGKYKGKPLSVAKSDSGYLKWVGENLTSRRDLIFSLKEKGII